MKFLIFLFSFSLLAFTSSAQNVTGMAKDVKGKALNGVTISLLKDSTVVKLAATIETGHYQFNTVEQCVYRIQSTYVGHIAVISKPITVSIDDVRIEVIMLTKASGNMTGVTVTARKPLVKVKAGKMILNVEGTINATGSDVMNLLRKSPGALLTKQFVSNKVDGSIKHKQPNHTSLHEALSHVYLPNIHQRSLSGQ
jgi:hypothetical protein